MNITTTAIVLYDNTSPPVPESTGEAGGFGHLPVTLSLQVEIQARNYGAATGVAFARGAKYSCSYAK